MIFLLSMLISHCHALLYQKSRRYSRGVKNGIIGTTRNHCEYILSMYINYYFSIIIIMNKCIYIYMHTYICIYDIHIILCSRWWSLWSLSLSPTRRGFHSATPCGCQTTGGLRGRWRVMGIVYWFVGHWNSVNLPLVCGLAIGAYIGIIIYMYIHVYIFIYILRYLYDTIHLHIYI